MKIKSIPKRGRKGSVIYSETRHGKVAREYVPPYNPRTAQQQDHRDNVRAVTGRWRTLSAEQRAAWCGAAANKYFVNEEGRRVRLNGYHFFVSLNVRRADLGLPQFDLPPTEPVFSQNPVDELVATYAGGKFTLKLRVPSPPAQVHPGARRQAGRDGGPLGAALPFPGAAAAPNKRLERHHRALRSPVWHAESRHGHLDPHLPAH